jgi:hypothetical protein
LIALAAFFAAQFDLPPVALGKNEISTRPSRGLALKGAQRIPFENGPLPVQLAISDVRIISRHLAGRFYTTGPHAIVILEHGQPANLLFCQALLRSKSLDVPTSLSPPQVPTVTHGEIIWYDERLPHEIQKFAKPGPFDRTECFELLDNFDYDGVHAYVENFPVAGRQGPWLLARDNSTRMEILLDFSAYEVRHFEFAIADWQRYIIGDHWLWRDRNEQAVSRLLFGPYWRENRERAIMIRRTP